ADYGRIRVLADRLGLEAIDRQGPIVVFRFRETGRDQPAARPLLDPLRLVKVVNARPDVTLVPPSSIKLDLRVAADARRPGPSRATKPAVPQPPRSRSARARGVPEDTSASWWTARAMAGEVTAGFTKAEILKPVTEDPRAPDGVFMRVGQLLSELTAAR
ncbi:MAG: hypothetical protein HY654_10810, partial [Acidobacteria bacterium]|nr:hypothetical protein [Acidobacteriota bacterium]